MNVCMVIVLVIQVITWAGVSTLLFYRGITNLWQAHYELNTTFWNSSAARSELPMKGYTSGVVILVIASIMIFVGPTFLIVVIVEKWYRRHRFKKLPLEDRPPKYEDVILHDMAPRYSSLFLNCENTETLEI